MLLVLDYDETYTADPVFWGDFIQSAKARGHLIVCCTMRFEAAKAFNEDVETDMGQYDIPIVYAARHRDKWVAMQDAGYRPENAIWIDDCPQYIFMNKGEDYE